MVKGAFVTDKVRTKEELIVEIKAKVVEKRRERNITPTPEPKAELSGIGCGEARVLAISLLRTTEGTGVWVDPPLEELKIDFLIELSQAIDEE